MLQVIDCDALVIGSGAGGAVAAHGLALEGLRPIVLEEGPRVSVKDIASMSSSQALSLLYRNAGMQPVFGDPKVIYGEGRCVGGSTMVNGGLLWFPSEWRVDRWRLRRGSLVPSFQELSIYNAEVARRLSMVSQTDGGGNRDSILMRVAAEKLGLKWQHPQRAVVGCSHSNRCTMGCPTGAKQTVQDTYLEAAERLGALIVPHCEVIRMSHTGRRIDRVHARIGGQAVVYRPNSVYLAAGAIGSPQLLIKSGLWCSREKPSLAWHANLRFIAKFDQKVNAESGTIFTAQINEYEKRGIYLMPANATPGTLAGFLQVHGEQAVRDYLEAPENWGVYTAQVEMEGRIGISNVPYVGRFLKHSLTENDRAALRFASERTTSVLFQGGAEQVFPPVNSFGAITSEADGSAFSRNTSIDRWQVICVHGMASCPMGEREKGGVVNELGRIAEIDNLHIVDASVLPAATGISPQGSIMTLAHSIMNKVS